MNDLAVMSYYWSRELFVAMIQYDAFSNVKWSINQILESCARFYDSDDSKMRLLHRIKRVK